MRRGNVFWKRALSLALALFLVCGLLPPVSFAEDTDSVQDTKSTVDDAETLTRPSSIYGDHTINAGKITVGKSVSDDTVALDADGDGDVDYSWDVTDTNNFLVTISQSAQAMGLSTSLEVPVDVVFVLDTSGSMGTNNQYYGKTGRAEAMVEAANSAIASLLAANDHNRVAVVAFSSASNNTAAANVLSRLHHYTGESATEHLRWVTSNGTAYSGNNNNNYGINTNYTYIQGRAAGNQSAGRRHGGNGGTNVHAGIALGAEQLLGATDTTVTVGGETLQRMPFIVVLSDGQPTYISQATTGTSWYDPTYSNDQGPGNGASGGIGFMTALSAAYFKGAVTDHYYGANATEKDRCFVYTIGVEMDELTGNSAQLANITMDPKTYFDAALNGTSNENSYYDTFNGYWASYNASRVRDFDVAVSDGNYTVTADSIRATTNYVHGNRTQNGAVQSMYAGGLQYNDGYYNATSISQLQTVFDSLVSEISLKAISSPTKVTGAEEFSGYVTFTDPLGEYMEVKGIKGLVSNGILYQGAGFAQKLVEYAKYLRGESSTYDAEFASTFRHVLTERMKLTQSTMEIDSYLKQAVTSPNQLNFVDATNYDNSILWWGHSYTAQGEEDAQMQVLSYAENDSIAYIESVKGTSVVPSTATHVCRSYFFYGTADAPVDEFLYFVVRVQRSLTAPYQQTVVISAPASLLSVERVLITESTDNSGNKTYTAKVQGAQPARVVYEVGLQDDINAYNVAQKVSAEYAAEAPADGVGQANVEGDTYYFFTNDWDRTAGATTHHRGMAKATFDAAHDNPYYAYTENTYITDANGNKITSSTLNPGTYYYVREYYDWSADADGVDANGAYTAVKKQTLIQIQITQAQINDENVIDKDATGWYVVAGNYKAYSISSGHDDYIKQPDNDGPAENGNVEAANITGTSNYVAHYHRTEDSSNSHYTVYLGNNGRLALKSIPTKSVSGTSTANPTITIENGDVVTVGDVLTYSVKVVNEDSQAVTADVTDLIPAGTTYVPGSASHSEYLSTVTTAGRVTTLSWNDVPVAAGKIVTITFQVTVDESALDASVNTINNTASVVLSNGVSYNTNPTHNPPEGKTVADQNGAAPTGGIQVGDILAYSIRFYNDQATAQTVVITDVLPTGTVYVSSDHGGVYDSTTNTVKWTLQVAPGEGGVVTFRAQVDASAKTPIENGATVKVGSNDPRVTNKTSTDLLTGELELSKEILVAAGVNVTVESLAGTEFTLVLKETGTDLDGDYAYSVDGTLVDNDKITFTAGVSENITIKHGQKIRIHDLPAGATVIVSETTKTGYTPTYSASDHVTVAQGAVVNVKVTNTYSPAAAPFQLTGTKTLSTDVPFAATTFTFTSQACDANGVVADGAVTVTAQATVSSDSKTASFSFPARSFANVGTYHYLVQETVNDTLTGVIFDRTQYLLTVTVADDGSGQLKATWTLHQKDSSGAFAAAASGATFTNSYVPSETELTLTGSKTVTNRTSQTEGEFSFAVKDKATGDTVTTGWNLADGKLQFNPITYTTVGTHTYLVSEVAGSNGKITYTDKVYEIEVTVKDNGGQLKAYVSKIDGAAVAEGGSYSLSFTNVYAPDPTQVTLTGTKTLTNSYENADRTLQAGEFTFRVDEVDKNGNVKIANVTFGSNVAAAAATPAAITFEPVNVTYAMYQAANTESDGNRYLYFRVYEVQPGASADPTVTYDTRDYYVKVPVGLNTATGQVTVGAPQYYYFIEANGELVKQEVEVPAFQNNAFSPPEEGTEVAIVVNKVLTGRDMAAGEFTFHLHLESDSMGLAQPGFIAAAHNTAAAAGTTGTVTFTRIYPSTALGDNPTANSTRVLVYSIHETEGSAAGVEYDTQVFTVTVTLTYDGEGDIHAQVTYPDNNNNTPVFENTYTAQPATYTPEAKKVLLGAGGTAIDVGSRFSFEVVALTPVVDAQSGEITGFTDGTTVSLGHTTGTDGVIAFDGISLNTAGTFYYRIQEVIGSATGVTYDAKPLYLKIVVTDDTSTGKLETVATYYTDDAFTVQTDVKQFVNHYGPGEVNFDLTLYKEIKTPSGRNYNRWMVAGSEFDFEIYHSDAAGTMGALVTYGENGASADSNSDGAYEPAVITFGTIRFTRADAYENGAVVTGTPSSRSHYFAVKEIAPREGSLPGITADTKTILIEVKVSDDGYGNMTAELVSPTAQADKTFTNTYRPADTTVTVNGNKQLSGKAWGNEVFSFTLSGGNLAAQQTIKNNADGFISFQLGFDSDDLIGAAYDAQLGIYYKDYTFKLVENQTQPENANTNGTYGYDLNVRTIQVRLYDDGTGQLKTEVSFQNAGSDVNEIIFVNPYTPNSITADLTEQIDADKAVDAKDGVTDYSKAGFTFKVLDLQGSPVIGADGTEVQGVSQADGSITFDTFKFDTYGWYYYSIEEVAPAAGEAGYKPGVTYDETVWNLRIEVEYNREDGKLGVKTVQMYKEETDVQADTGDTVEFTNIYDPASVSVEFVVGKELTGRDLAAGEFQFQIARVVDGNLVIAGEESNDAEGNVAFQLTMDAVGTYTYKIYEVIPSDAVNNVKNGVTYNTATLSVTVTVKDENKDGQLEAYIGDTLIADGAGAAADKLVLRNTETGAFTITNRYAPATAYVDIYAFKSLEGKDLTADAFTFELVDAQGNVIKTATNAADGTVVFEDVPVTAAGEVTYTIREKEGTDANTEYDEEAYEVTVKAEDDGLGKLNVTVTYGEDNEIPTFVNVFTPDKITVTLEGTKTLTGRKQEAGEFTFTVYDSTGKKVSSGTNDAEGKITFEKIGLPVVGRYVFTVVEDQGSAKGVTYDKTEFTVTVEVVNENGVLKATTTYPEGGVAFENTYTAPPSETPETGDTTPILMLILLAVLSLAAMAVMLVLIRRRKHNG